MQNVVFIISGPAGAGKNTLWNLLKEEVGDMIEESISTTTRVPIRKWEKEGVDYYFVSKEIFEQKIHASEFLEFARVHTFYYGSTKGELERITNAGKIPLYIIEPQGMVHIKPILEDKGYRVVTFFITPPSIDELKVRLGKRGTETEEQFEIRLATALTEYEQKELYDYHIINDTLDSAKKSLLDTIFLETNYSPLI